MPTIKTTSATISCILLATLLAASCSPDLIFGVRFTSQASSDLTQSEQNLFTNAINFWDAIIIDHQDFGSRTWTLNVDTFSQPASGGGVVLGSAGPSGAAFSGIVPGAATSNQRYIISTGGNANFNVHPDAGAISFDTIIHEIAHALGFGALREDNEVYNDGDPSTGFRTLAGGIPGEYVGANALAAWQNEFVG